MDLKRIFKSPLWWLLALVLVLAAWLTVGDPTDYREVDTSAAVKLIKDGRVESAKLVDNNRVDLTLKDGQLYTEGKIKDAKHVRAHYIEARGAEMVKILDAKTPPKGYDEEPPPTRPSWRCSATSSRCCCSATSRGSS